MTGETEKGRSMRVTSRFLPGKLNFAMAQAAVTPKKRLSGTVTAAVMSVSLMDDRVSGSLRASR